MKISTRTELRPTASNKYFTDISVNILKTKNYRLTKSYDIKFIFPWRERELKKKTNFQKMNFLLNKS